MITIELACQAVASGRRLEPLVGLAPARLCLKGRLRELLCIHGLLA